MNRLNNIHPFQNLETSDPRPRPQSRLIAYSKDGSSLSVTKVVGIILSSVYTWQMRERFSQVLNSLDGRVCVDGRASDCGRKVIVVTGNNRRYKN